MHAIFWNTQPNTGGQHLAGEDAEKQLEPLIMEFLWNEQLRKSAFQALQFRREYASKDLADDIFDAILADQGELHIAAYWDLTHIAKKFLEASADASAADSHKWTPLY